MHKIETAYYQSPIGILEIKGNKKGIKSIYFVDEKTITEEDTIYCDEISQCLQQLKEYFNKKRDSFDLTVRLNGSSFQARVWQHLLTIPYGKTQSYLEQSRQLGDVKSIRAVASANSRNPVSIIIPCHRVIGSDGSLTGYAGGVWRKKWLLEHEGAIAKQESLF